MKINYTMAVDLVYKTIVILLLGLIATLLWTIENGNTENTIAVIDRIEGIDYILNQWELTD